MSIDSSEGEESGFEKQFCVLKLIMGPIFPPDFFFIYFLFYLTCVSFSFTLHIATRDKVDALLAQYSA